MKKRLWIFGIILTLATGAAAQVSSLQQKAERALATYFMTYSGKNTARNTPILPIIKLISILAIIL